MVVNCFKLCIFDELNTTTTGELVALHSCELL